MKIPTFASSAPGSATRGLRESPAWAVTLGTLGFALVSYWLVGVSVAPSYEGSELEAVLKSILSADAAWFLLLGWFLTSSFYLGADHWRRFAAAHVKWPRAARTVAWRRFRSGLWLSLCLGLGWTFVVRKLGLLNLSSPGFDPKFLLSQLYLITDPLSSFVLLFLVLDLIRVDLYTHAIKAPTALLVTFLVSVGVEVWVWAEYLGLNSPREWLIPLILAILWGAIKTYQGLLRARSGAFWQRLGAGLGLFVVFDLGLSLVDSPWSSGWSFLVVEARDSVLLLVVSVLFLAAANIAALHRFCRPLTRVD